MCNISDCTVAVLFSQEKHSLKMTNNDSSTLRKVYDGDLPRCVHLARSANGNCCLSQRDTPVIGGNLPLLIAVKLLVGQLSEQE